MATGNPDSKPVSRSESVVRETLDTHVADVFEIIIAGGGAAGLIAAITAAKRGGRVLLVERQGCLGGTATTGYVAQYIGFFNHDTQAVWGLPFEFTRRITDAGGSPGFGQYVLAEASANPIDIRNFPFDPEIVKWVADEWVVETGVELLLHANVVGVLLQGDRVDGIVVEDVGGRRAFRAEIVIDATGDATVAHHACVAMQVDDDPRHARQPQSLVFRLSNVDVARFRALPREEKRRLALNGIARGELFWESLSFMSTPGGTDAISLMSRIRGINPLDPRQATKAERIGRAQVKSIVSFLKREVPGFEKAIVANIAPRVGVRETRRIVGAHTLTEEEILEETRFEDSIALGCGPMDIHDADGTGVQLFMPPAPFEIPMRCLLPVGVSGLIVTGRAISATRSANGGARHMATAMALGQAAGSIALVATRENIATRAVPADRVQSMLREDDAVVTTPECLARAATKCSTGPLETGGGFGQNITVKEGGA